MIGTAKANSIKIAPRECLPRSLPLPCQQLFVNLKNHYEIPSISDLMLSFDTKLCKKIFVFSVNTLPVC